jgi:Flp pilus assembly protein TadB
VSTLAPVAICAAALAAAAAVPPVPRSPHRAAGRQRRSLEDGSVRRATVAVSVGLGVTVLVGHLTGVAAGAVVAVVAWQLTGRLEPPAARRHREQIGAALPHVVDLMAACLAVGMAPGAAVERISRAVEPPMSAELEALSARLRLGVDPVTVWRDLARHPQLGVLGRCIARAVDSGSSVADAMARLSEDLRREGRAAVESKARAVGVKAAVPLGVCMLPAFVLVGVVPLVAGSVSLILGR